MVFAAVRVRSRERNSLTKNFTTMKKFFVFALCAYSFVSFFVSMLLLQGAFDKSITCGMCVLAVFLISMPLMSVALDVFSKEFGKEKKL